MTLDVRAIGYDVDQTLYPDLPEFKNAVRAEFYKFIALKRGIDVAKARDEFEAAYAELGSSSPAFMKCGIADPREAVRDCLDTADVSRLLQRDHGLVDMMTRLGERGYIQFIITDGRRENTQKKLDALGVTTHMVSPIICWDAPLPAGELKKETGKAFRYVQEYLRLEPERIAFVGNSEKDDIVRPNELGWKTVYVGGVSKLATASIARVLDLEKLV